MVESAALHPAFLDTKVLIEKLKLQLPSQPPPRWSGKNGATKWKYHRPVGGYLW